jgi:hypothetical protein
MHPFAAIFAALTETAFPGALPRLRALFALLAGLLLP